MTSRLQAGNKIYRLAVYTPGSQGHGSRALRDVRGYWRKWCCVTHPQVGCVTVLHPLSYEYPVSCQQDIVQWNGPRKFGRINGVGSRFTTGLNCVTSKQIQYMTIALLKNCSLIIIPNADIILPKIETSISSPNINIEKITITSSKGTFWGFNRGPSIKPA